MAEKTQAYDSTPLYTVFRANKHSKAKAALVANGSKPCIIEVIARPKSEVICKIVVGQSGKLARVKIALSKNWGCCVNFPAFQSAETSSPHLSPRPSNFSFDLSQFHCSFSFHCPSL